LLEYDPENLREPLLSEANLKAAGAQSRCDMAIDGVQKAPEGPTMGLFGRIPIAMGFVLSSLRPANAD
jgi:hypothetical protein